VIALPRSNPQRPERMREAWEELWLRFEDLSGSSNDYMGNMRQQERERLLDLEAFQVYKEALLTYLTRFAEGLASYRSRISPRVAAWPVDELAQAVAEGALTTTRLLPPTHCGIYKLVRYRRFSRSTARLCHPCHRASPAHGPATLGGQTWGHFARQRPASTRRPISDLPARPKPDRAGGSLCLWPGTPASLAAGIARAG